MQTAKLFRHGGSQAVRLPVEFRFDAAEVFVWRDATTGNVVLSTHPASWADFLAQRDRLRDTIAQEAADFPAIPVPLRLADPFAGWLE